MTKPPQLAVMAALFALSSPASAAEWKKAAEEKGVTIYTRDKAGSDIKEVKAVGTVDSPPYACMNVVEDLGNFKSFMPYTKESAILGREGDKVVYTYQFLSLPLVSDRDYALRIVDESPAAAAGAEPAYYKSAWTPANDRGPPPREDVVRVKINTGYWRFDPIDGGKRSKVTYYLFTDPGGMIPAFLANRANTQTIPEMFAAVRKQSKLARYQTPRVRPVQPAAGEAPTSAPAPGGG